MRKEPPMFINYLLCETGAHYTAQVHLELPVFLLLPPPPPSAKIKVGTTVPGHMKKYNFKNAF